ncbi:MAG: tandem-95 repeat protein [Phycisphaerae bacterium]|nr:tandem-95 repeat protein [Phycisphaerae bacterium]
MKNRNSNRIGLLVSLVCLAGWVGMAWGAPKNIILFIGDGMGPEQVRAAGYYVNGLAGVFPFEGFPFQGYLTTYSANSSITDSAAAGTALATGYKVNNDVISVAIPANVVYSYGQPMLTMLEYFKSTGKSTGLVTTAFLTDATPAAFGSHEASRSNYNGIAGDYYTQTQPNVLLGGGGNDSVISSPPSFYLKVTDRSGLLGIDTESTSFLAGLFGTSDFPYLSDNQYGTTYPQLAEMTDVALRILDNNTTNGFFLMVEGSRIDDACHANDLVKLLPEVHTLSDAVQVAINWAAGRSDTLIIVTADHETGGLSVGSNQGAGVYPAVTWSTTGHTATNVPAYAWGVNADLISGGMNNTDMFGVVADNPPVELVNPPYDAVQVSTSPTLEVKVQAPAPANVTFLGRQKPFTIIAMGDTQNYTQSNTRAIYDAQTRWIAKNADALNIVFVTHQGDVVNTWDNLTEWANAVASMSILEGVVSYGLLPGNHDQPNIDGTPNATYFNLAFPFGRFDNHFPTTGNQNNFHLFSAGGDDYIILHIEDWPDQGTVGPVIAWANDVLNTYSSRKAIITTHGYLTTSGGYEGKWGSTQYIRDTLVVPHDNVYFVLCGHFGEFTKTTAVGSRWVHELMSCYHSGGYLRIMQFVPGEDKVYVQTYSPWLDAYLTDADSQFTLDFPMTGNSFTQIGTVASAGSNVSLPWPGLSLETQYEWYVNVNETTDSPVWNFTTASPKANHPNPAIGAIDVDINADLSWTAGIGAVSHDVYFGTHSSTLALVSSEQASTSYDPGTLQEGTTYYWAVDEHDSVGGITYGPVWRFTTPVPGPEVILTAGSVWKYNDTNTDLYSQGWPTADDSLWESGPAPLGYGDAHIVTSLTMGNTTRYPSYYFRKSFTLDKEYQSATLKVLRDDGCVVYLNGVEVVRSGMPTSAITHTTFSSITVSDAAETTYYEFTIDPALLTLGNNILAVDVHQCNSTSSDLGFDLQLEGVPAPVVSRPVANDDTTTTTEDTAVEIAVLANDTDPDSDPLTVGSITQPSHGTVTFTSNSVTYTPAANFSGADSFTYQATDGTNLSNSATVTVTVTNADNDPPTANAGEDQTVTDDDGSGAEVTLHGEGSTDMDGTIESYAWTEGSTPIATGATPIVSLLGGVHTLTLTVTDDGGATATDTVTITVEQPNFDAYVAVEPTVTFGAVVGTIAGTTATDDGNTQSISETPNGVAAYSLLIEYTLHTLANPANISEPVILNFSHTWSGGTTDPLKIELLLAGAWTNITSQMSNGQYSASAASMIDAQGNIRIRFSDTVNAKKETKDTLIIDLLYAQIIAGPPNNPPTAVNDSYPVDEDTVLEIAAPGVLENDSDVDGQTITVSEFTEPGNGTLAVATDGSFTYTPNENFNGNDNFTYTIHDSKGAAATATVTITIGAVNDNPVAVNDSATVAQGAGVEIAVLANDFDIDGDSLTVTAVESPTSGTAVIGDNKITYTSALDYTGMVSFDYTASDEKGGTAAGTVSVTVTRINTPPVADPDSYVVAEDDTLTVPTPGVLENDSDADSDPLTALVIAGPSHGSLTLNLDGSFSYTPSANYNGSDSFTYTANDGLADSTPATVSIIISPVNDNPVADNDSATTTQNTPIAVSVLANDSDIDGDSLAITDVTAPTNGTAVISGTTITYTPNTGFFGTDSFAYSIRDGKGGTASGTVTISVQANNTLSVTSIVVTGKKAGKSYFAQAVVTIMDQTNHPVSGAVVSGKWYLNGTEISTGSASTAEDGTVTFNSPKVSTGGTFRFEVTGIVLDGYTYIAPVPPDSGEVTYP